MTEKFYVPSQNLHLSKINCDVEMIHFNFEMKIVICMLLLYWRRIRVNWYCKFLIKREELISA